MKRSPFDWLASLLVPGWTQIMYLRPAAAVFFLLGAAAGWIAGGWAGGVPLHVLAAIHGATLVADFARSNGGFGRPDPRFGGPVR